MKTPLLVVLGALLVPAVAAAQPASQPVGAVPAYGYAQPQGYAMPPGPPTAPGGFHDRLGHMQLGFSFGVGKLKIDDSDVACSGCDADPVSFALEGHIGWMMSPRLALQFEIQGIGQTIAETSTFTDTLVQTSAIVGAQYWITPQLYIKGGLGAAQMAVTRDDGFETQQSDALEGGIVMGAVGYEVLSARNFAIDLQLRATGGAFEDGTEEADGTVHDSKVGTTSLNLGFNWY